MVQEKVDAMVEGTFAAQTAWGTFLIKAAFGGMRTPQEVSVGLAGIAQAAGAPARKKVRANARRLTGTRHFPEMDVVIICTHSSAGLRLCHGFHHIGVESAGVRCRRNGAGERGDSRGEGGLEIWRRLRRGARR